jgi:hypothetical protein
MDERPEALLKSALEKIVYFEARSEQLQSDFEQKREECERLKADLAAAAQREIELRRVVAELEVRSTRSHALADEAGRVADGLRRERAELIGKMLEASRIHASDQPQSPDAYDLASFISELRSDVLTLTAKRGQTPFPPPPEGLPLDPEKSSLSPFPPPAPSPVTALAHQLKSEGRLSVPPLEVRASHTDETLFGFSVRELSAPDAGARVRAAERLKALGQPAAAPALAAALHGETEPAVQVALLQAFATFAKGEGVPIVAPLLRSPSPDVRIAALKALLTLDAAQAGPHLAAAVRDPDRAVRRRASLLALSLTGGAALELGEQAIHDDEPEVRALAALVLGASAAEAARPMLLAAMRDGDLKVRKAAAQSLSRLLGKDVVGVVELDDAQRRREVRKLQTLPSQPKLYTPAPAPMKAKVAVIEGPSEVQVLIELRASIRGRTLAELASNLSQPENAVRGVCVALVQKGQAVQRGVKYFVA